MLRPIIVLCAIKLFIIILVPGALAASGANSCILLFTMNPSIVANHTDQIGKPPIPDIYSENLHNRFRLAGDRDSSLPNYDVRLASRLLQLGESLHSRYGGRLDSFTSTDPATQLTRQIIEHYQTKILTLVELYEANKEEINLIKKTFAIQVGSTRKLRAILEDYIQEQDFHFKTVTESIVRSRLAQSIYVLGDPSFLFKNNFTKQEIELIELLIAQVR